MSQRQESEGTQSSGAPQSAFGNPQGLSLSGFRFTRSLSLLDLEFVRKGAEITRRRRSNL